MNFKIYFYGKFKLGYYFPTFSAVDICSDSDNALITHRWYQFAWFGISVNIEKTVKDGKAKPAYFFSLDSFFK
jgi:hypothetical protein